MGKVQRHGSAASAPFVRALCALLVCAGAALAPSGVRAQNCTTQARMTPQQRTAVGSAAFQLATAVITGDEAAVRAMAVSGYAGDLNQTGYLVRSTAQRIAGDNLTVTQAYLLDGSARKPGDSSEADFSCPLLGSSAETDFSISGLPTGQFAFVMVEARGPAPWLLAFLLQQQGGQWKMAGFYPHPRTAAGHDGVWYWTAARNAAKANDPWLSWLLYGEADRLLRPAPFVDSSALDKLTSEQHDAAPQPLSGGLSAQTPTPLRGAGGEVYEVTSLYAEGSADGKALNLWMHIQGQDGLALDAARSRNLDAGRALLRDHPALRPGFVDVWIVSDLHNREPVVVQKPIAELVTAAK